ncbi:MAG: hypothetical protein LBJ00_11190 [Planctomycetaceae bacterium]|nr:hypothetical protein [Planctomycetaceae bacterium]
MECLEFYTVAGKAIGFALEQPLHVVAFACSALGILRQLQHKENHPHPLRMRGIIPLVRRG